MLPTWKKYDKKNHFIFDEKFFLNNKMPIFEAYGAFNKNEPAHDKTYSKI